MANILFVGGGKRYDLGKLFTDRGHKLFSYELSEDCPISDVAIVVKGFRWFDEKLFSDLENCVKFNNIALIVPLMDIAVVICSQLDLPDSCKVLSPNYTANVQCYNKELYADFMIKNFRLNYPVIRGFPLIAKPKTGHSSTGIFILESVPDCLVVRDSYILQEKINGDEYSVDAYFTPDGKYVDSIPRSRDRVGSGEVMESETIDDSELQRLTKEIGEKLGIGGPINCQFIVGDGDAELVGVYNIETNVRFGGGSTFSIAAGLPLIRLIERDYLGADFDYVPGKWKKNFKLIRTFRDHYYE